MWTSFCVTTWLTRIASAFTFTAYSMSFSFGHLRAEVVGLDHRVALEAVVVVVALHVHDGVDADGVRVEAGAGADDDDLAADARSRIASQASFIE